MTEKSNNHELAEVQKHVARDVARLDQKRETLIKSLRQVELELETLRPVAAAAFGTRQ
jgi:hypothetical protein